MRNQNLLQAWLVPIIAVPACLLVAKFVEFTSGGYVQLLLIYCCINIILAVSLNLINGFTGQFSLGHAGFMAIGAYLSAWLSTKFVPISGAFAFLNFPLYACCGGALAALAGLLVGMPSLRLKGDYLAIVTLGFGEIIRVILLNMDAVGGARGFDGIPSVPGFDLAAIHLSPFFVSFSMDLLWVVATILFVSRLVRSKQGRGFLSVREDEIAAEAMGISTTQVKVQAFVISSFFAGVAGSMFAHFANYLNPSSFQFLRSVDVVIMVVLGGMGSITG